jgi:simple sugar transport system ATP-binding protein
MQKLILGRALMHPERSASPDASQGRASSAPRLIVAHQPTWGLDIGAVAYVQAQLIAARDAGAAVLLISDDLDEVLTLGDRVAVMHGGCLSEARPALDWSREAIGLAMAGVGAEHAGYATEKEAA